ncbi:MAG: hypothetical protein J5960_08775 [Desulfovibrio sp.]|nr:hypothetical protein [Desulfovibrio sp.]
MQMKNYKVTNNGEGSICLAGRVRIDIPGMCKDVLISLPDDTAKATVSRLKQRYPLLKIVEVADGSAEARQPQASTASDADKASDAPKTDGAAPAQAAKEGDSPAQADKASDAPKTDAAQANAKNGNAKK